METALPNGQGEVTNGRPMGSCGDQWPASGPSPAKACSIAGKKLASPTFWVGDCFRTGATPRTRTRLLARAQSHHARGTCTCITPKWHRHRRPWAGRRLFLCVWLRLEQVRRLARALASLRGRGIVALCFRMQCAARQGVRESFQTPPRAFAAGFKSPAALVSVCFFLSILQLSFKPALA